MTERHPDPYAPRTPPVPFQELWFTIRLAGLEAANAIGYARYRARVHDLGDGTVEVLP